MKKLLMTFALLMYAFIINAQPPLTYSKNISLPSETKEELYKKAQQFFLVAFDSYKEILNTEDSIVVEGYAYIPFNVIGQYSSIKGNINYKGSTVIKNGAITFIMHDFTHEGTGKAAFDNNMGVLVEELPKNLSDIGISGATRKMCYKFYYKNGTPLCKKRYDETFEKLAAIAFK